MSNLSDRNQTFQIRLKSLLLLVAVLAVATRLWIWVSPPKVPRVFHKIFNKKNGHYYTLIDVEGKALGFDEAANLAASQVFSDRKGHLATVTSQQENDFLVEHYVKMLPWGTIGFVLGGTDEATEGVWVWVCGPEKGQVFYGPGAEPGAYSNWDQTRAKEPNNQIVTIDDPVDLVQRPSTTLP